VKTLGKLIAASLVLGAGAVIAQTPPARLEFEVASIKPREGLVAGQPVSGGMLVDGAQIHLIHYQLKSFITMAYSLRPYQVIGPDWLQFWFDIDARLPAGSNRNQLPEMMRSLLADRFQMKFHNQSKDFPVYALLVGGGGTKLKDLNLPPDEPDHPVEATGYGGPIAWAPIKAMALPTHWATTSSKVRR
jgi:uncharacterized protein (TIGR03435 family)